MTLYARQQKRQRYKEQILDSVGEGEGGMIWENSIETWAQGSLSPTLIFGYPGGKPQLCP